MHKITPHLWYDHQAVEAANFYCENLSGSKVDYVKTLPNTPSGDTDVVSFTLSGQPFMAISAGPLFKFTPAASFTIRCGTEREVDDLWAKFSEGGEALMPLDSYPFSKRFGWTQDRYGLSWQIIHVDDRSIEQRIIPSLLFVGDVCGKAEQAIELYMSVFPGSGVDLVDRYGEGEGPDAPGTVRHARFKLAGYQFSAMDSAHEHNFAFNEAVSFMVICDSQEEIDHYWKALSAVPEAEQCGWLKDPFGLSWQIVPRVMSEMLSKGTQEQIARVTETFLPMKKLDTAKLQSAYEGS